MFGYLIVDESEPSPFFLELGLIISREENVKLLSLLIPINVALQSLDDADAVGAFLPHSIELCWSRHA